VTSAITSLGSLTQECTELPYNSYDIQNIVDIQLFRSINDDLCCYVMNAAKIETYSANNIAKFHGGNSHGTAP
jgi:hypothetical protein